LFARQDLVEKWNSIRLLDSSLFGEISFGTESFGFLCCHKKYNLEPLESGKSPESVIGALAFSTALKESRKLSVDVSFHDAIYVEQYSRLLPTWTLSRHVDDEVVLGTWLTGGVVIATTSFRRLAHLTNWMAVDDLRNIVKTAGLSVQCEQSMSIRDAARASRVFRLPGRQQLEAFFNEHIIDIIFNSEKYQMLGIDFPSAVILHGPPGCGKTFAVDRLVEFIDWPVYYVNSNTVGSPFIHDTSKKISEVFDQAIKNAPSVVVIDEMESFLADRIFGGQPSLYHIEEVAEFLRRIPEAIRNKVLVVAMTNIIEMIDPAILRRGRFDHVIEVGMPSREEVAALVDSLLSGLPTTNDINLENLLDALTGNALSDAAFVIRESARLAAKSGKTQINQENIAAALCNLPKEQQLKNKRVIGFARDE